MLSVKYLNDSSPKNKHWYNYSVIQNSVYNFGFSSTEGNLMEKQLLNLLNRELRITEIGSGLNVEYQIISASPGTLTMEMTRLSEITDNAKYYDAISRVMDLFYHVSWSEQDCTSRHVPHVRLDGEPGAVFTLAGRADSLYST
jgi:hypothetical protein